MMSYRDTIFILVKLQVSYHLEYILWESFLFYHGACILTQTHINAYK